jgi:hypothetical protein
MGFLFRFFKICRLFLFLYSLWHVPVKLFVSCFSNPTKKFKKR